MVGPSARVLQIKGHMSCWVDGGIVPRTVLLGELNQWQQPCRYISMC